MRDEKYKLSNGFTLIEILIAVLLLGITITAIVGANAAFSQQSDAARQLSAAEFLAGQIRELTAALPVSDPNGGSDIYALDNITYNPPVDGLGAALTGFNGFSQQIVVENVHPNNFQQTVADYSSDYVRITANIFYGGSQILQRRWFRFAE